jgi:hypothetical protein
MGCASSSDDPSTLQATHAAVVRNATDASDRGAQHANPLAPGAVASGSPAAFQESATFDPIVSFSQSGRSVVEVRRRRPREDRVVSARCSWKPMDASTTTRPSSNDLSSPHDASFGPASDTSSGPPKRVQVRKYRPYRPSAGPNNSTM